jgi:hypothetical protein
VRRIPQLVLLYIVAVMVREDARLVSRQAILGDGSPVPREPRLPHSRSADRRCSLHPVAEAAQLLIATALCASRGSRVFPSKKLLLGALPLAAPIEGDGEDAGRDVEVFGTEVGDPLICVGDISRRDRRFEIVPDNIAIAAELKARMNESVQVGHINHAGLLGEQPPRRHPRSAVSSLRAL